MAERLTPFFQLLKTTDAKAKTPITPDIKKEVREINQPLERCCQLALLPDKQLDLINDANFEAAGYAVLVEDDPTQKDTHINTQNMCSYSVGVGFKDNTPAEIKIAIYVKEILAIYLASNEFGDIFPGATKPVITMTEQSSHQILPDKKDSSTLMECLHF